MKVNVNVTLDIDPESWTMNYGVEGAKQIREDVKTHVDNLIIESLRDLGLLKEEI